MSMGKARCSRILTWVVGEAAATHAQHDDCKRQDAGEQRCDQAPGDRHGGGCAGVPGDDEGQNGNDRHRREDLSDQLGRPKAPREPPLVAAV
jgi:hypothetical protein